MWQQLNQGQIVSLGDQLRYIESSVLLTENVFKVVKATEHYFEIVTEKMDYSLSERQMLKRIVKYLDIGYIDYLEVWVD